MTKGIVKPGLFCNVKTMDGTVLSPTKQMQAGEYAYGTKGPTDLMNFDHYYLKDNTRVPLGKLCKANIANMITSEEPEPGTDPEPDPDPTPDPDSVVEIIDSVITWRAADGSIRTTRMIPE